MPQIAKVLGGHSNATSAEVEPHIGGFRCIDGRRHVTFPTKPSIPSFLDTPALYISTTPVSVH
jgi:hypothetical protein